MRFPRDLANRCFATTVMHLSAELLSTLLGVPGRAQTFTFEQWPMVYRSLQGGKKWKIWKNRKMHKTAREKRSEFNSGARMYRKKICTTFIFFWKNVFEKIFRPRLWHLRWCQMIAQTSPKLFGKTSFLTPKLVWNMSKKCPKKCIKVVYFDYIVYIKCM